MTGARDSLPSTVGRLVRDVVAASPVPVGVGFGVSRPAHVRALAKAGAGGVIVASALVDALGDDGRDVDRMAALVRDLAGRDRAPRVKVDVAIEAGQKKAFATAVDWPGWSRSGKTEDAAVESLIAYAGRYAPIAKAAGEAFDPDKVDVDVVERLSRRRRDRLRRAGPGHGARIVDL